MERPEYPLESPYEHLTNEERRLRVAKYMLLKACNFGLTEYMIVKIARNDVPEHQFVGAIRKALYGQYHGAEGFDEAHLETTAVELGLDEVIWPSDEREV